MTIENTHSEWASPYAQQGDCIVRKVGEEFAEIFGEIWFPAIPVSAKKTANPVVLQGLTNSHAIVAGEIEIFEDNGRIFLLPKTPCVLDHVKDIQSRVHAQHHALLIPPREKGYFIYNVNEYNHAKEESRKVVD